MEQQEQAAEQRRQEAKADNNHGRANAILKRKLVQHNLYNKFSFQIILSYAILLFQKLKSS